MFRFAGKEMPSPQENGEDRATAAVLACGGTDGVPAFVLRHWRPGGGSTEPVFITWLLGVGRFCLTVKYGRYSLRGEDWRLDTGPGLRAAPSPLEQARFEAFQVGEALRRRLNRRVPVSPALALFDMKRDRRIERIARQGGVPLLWDLERCTGRLADAATGAPCANRWKGARPWRRYPHWSRTPPPRAWHHPGPRGGGLNPHRGHRRRRPRG